MLKTFIVIAEWDTLAHVWVATSEDIPGLVTIHKSLDRLLERVVVLAPELLEEAIPMTSDARVARDIEIRVRVHLDAFDRAA